MMYSTIIEHINGGGLELLYKAMLESSKEEFCAALDTVLQVRLQHHPIICHDGRCALPWDGTLFRWWFVPVTQNDEHPGA